MIADLKPYPAMKDSGVPWLGAVPKHWEIVRLKSIMSNVIRQTDERKQADLYVALEHVESWTGRLRQAAVDVLFDSQVKCFRSGDILFGKLRPYLAKVARPLSGGVCVGEFLVLRSRASNTSSAYMEQLLRSKPIIDIINSSTFGAKMPRADWQFIGGMAVALPSIPDQAAVVRFLGHADRQIQHYIRAKQKLGKLLAEQKQAILHRAVTRGLNPGVRLKPSGVKWLGPIPEHWGVSQVRSIAQVVRGSSPRPAGSPLYFHGDAAPWITVGEITKDEDVYLRGTTTRLTELGAERSRTIRPGTLLLTNSGATLGVPKISRIEGCINDGVAAFLRVTPRVNKEFLYFYWRTQTSHLRAWMDLGAQPNLNTQIIGGWPVLLPPPAEQQDIVDWVRLQTASSDSAIGTLIEEISFVREYRTRLIADVVTGKLDVREAAARLPEEAEEQEAFEEREVETDDELDAIPDEAVA